MILPPSLSPGSVVRVVAPSSPFEPRLIWRGMGWLAERYEVRFDHGIFASRGFLAGDDERRRQELQAALNEPDVAAIVCARGGYGLSRYVHMLDLEPMVAHPRWLVGFSDVTALHVELAKVDVASLHGCHVTAMGQGNAVLREQLVCALENPCATRRFDALEVVSGGRTSGPLYGGNLTVLHACAAAGRLSPPRGCVLLLEDVTELPYRIDRVLTTLLVGGHLDGVAAVVLGAFTGCGPGRDGVRVEEVIAERLVSLGVPIVTGLPVGHGRDNEPVVLGAPTTVDGASVTLFG